MVCITLGTYKKDYKYLLFYLLCRIINEIILGIGYDNLYKPIYFWDKQEKFKNHQLINDIFSYLGVYISSFIIKKYEPKEKDYKIEGRKTIKLIHNNNSKFDKLIYSVFFVSFLSVSHEILSQIYYKSNLRSLDYWTIEIFTTYYIYKKMFKYEIYYHQKCSMHFASFFCSLLICSKFILKYNNEDKLIFKKYILFIPIGIITFFIILIIKSYSNCKIKWLTDVKYLPINKFLRAYGFLGSIISFFLSLIATFKDCGKDPFDICKFENKKNQTQFYESFRFIYYDFFSNQSIKVIIIYLLSIISIMIISAFNSMIFILVIKYLNPFYTISLSSMYYFLIQIILLIKTAFGKNELEDNERYKIIIILIEIITSFCFIIAIFIYSEIIELNCYNLSYNIRKNISIRSEEDFNCSMEGSILEEEDEDEDEEEDQIKNELSTINTIN